MPLLLKANIEWFGTEEVRIDSYELIITKPKINTVLKEKYADGAACLKFIIDDLHPDTIIEELPSKAIKQIADKKEIFNEKLRDLAEVYHADEWELHSDVMDLVVERQDSPRKIYRRARRNPRRP